MCHLLFLLLNYWRFYYVFISRIGNIPIHFIKQSQLGFLCYHIKLCLCGKISDSIVSLNKQMVIRNQTTTGEYPSVCLSNIFVLYKLPLGRNLRIKEVLCLLLNNQGLQTVVLYLMHLLITMQRPDGTDRHSEEATEDYTDD